MEPHRTNEPDVLTTEFDECIGRVMTATEILHDVVSRDLPPRQYCSLIKSLLGKIQEEVESFEAGLVPQTFGSNCVDLDAAIRQRRLT